MRFWRKNFIVLCLLTNLWSGGWNVPYTWQVPNRKECSVCMKSWIPRVGFGWKVRWRPAQDMAGFLGCSWSIVKPDDIPMATHVEFVQVPLDGISFLTCVNHTSHPGVIRVFFPAFGDSLMGWITGFGSVLDCRSKDCRGSEAGWRKSWVGRVTCAEVWGGSAYQGTGLAIARRRIVIGCSWALSLFPYSLPCGSINLLKF